MPMSCAVADCSSISGNTSPEISYFTFPVNDRLTYLRWISLCKRGVKFTAKSAKNARMCSVHFKESDFQRDMKSELLNLKKRRILNAGAIPSIFPGRALPQRSSSSVSRDERMDVRERKEMVKQILEETKENELPDITVSNSCDASCQTAIKKVTLEALEKRLVRADNRIKRQQKTISNLKSLNKNLRQRIKNAKPLLVNERVEKPSFLSPCQQRKLEGKYVRWSTSDIVKALSLRSASLKAYETAQKVLKLPLPSTRTLRQWASNFSCRRGILSEVVSIMKTQAESMEIWERVCGICFDEMSTSSQFVYDKESDEIVSGSNAQVVMVRGLCSGWKQPIFFNFDTPMTKELLFDIIKTLENAGYPVLTMSNDLGGGNRSLSNDLGISLDCCYFQNPVAQRKIYVFADVPHLLKLLRNHILDDGMQFPSGTKLTKSTFETLIKYDNSEIKLCPYLNYNLIEVTGSERMRVRPAARLLSNHVGELAARVLKDEPEIPEAIKLFNSGWDVMNSRIPYDPKNPMKSAFGTDYERQVEILQKFRTLILESRFLIKDKKTGELKPKKSLHPFQIGFVISIDSHLGVFSLMKQILPNFKYLLTSKLNQDCLESLFSRIRAFGGAGVNPTPVEFRYRLRLILLGSKIRSPKGTNVNEIDEADYMSTNLIKKNRLRNDVTETNQQEKPSVVALRVSNRKTDDVLHDDALQYLSGYIAWRLKRQEKGIFGYPTETRINGTWISTLSRGKLLTPTAQFHDWILKCNSIFVRFMKTKQRALFVKSTVCKTMKESYPDVPSFVVADFLKVRLKIRTNFLNNLVSGPKKRKQAAKNKQFAQSAKRN